MSLTYKLGGSFLMIGVCLLVEVSFVAMIPLMVRHFIDVSLPSKDLGAVYPLMALLAVGYTLAFPAGMLRDFLTARAQSRMLSRLRRRMYDRIQQLSMSAFTLDGNQAFIKRFSVDCEDIENGWRDLVSRGMVPLIEAIVCSLVALVVNWPMGVLSLALWPWILLTPRAVGVRADRADTQQGDDEQRFISVVEENLSTQGAVRAFSLEQMSLIAFRKRNEALTRSAARAGLLGAYIDRFTGTGVVLIQISVLGLSMKMATGHDMSVGTLVSLQILVLIVARNLLSVAEYVPERDRAKDALERAEEVMLAPGGLDDAKDAKELPPFEHEIGFSNVSFAYSQTVHPQVSFLTARIPKGAYVAFVGPSGSGKTTLLRLMMRFIDPTDGMITIDGHDLRALKRASLRTCMGVVLQDNPLFNLSVIDNLKLGFANASLERVVEAAKVAGVHDLITALPQGYDTMAGVGGVRFPAAVMQRIAIARAILRDPDILLLDEIASSLEPADELSVNEVLRNLRIDRTVISMTHRLATVADADHIFMLEDGRIVEQGSHFELMAAEGAYAALWRKQAGFNFSSDGRHVDVDAARLKSFPILEKLDDDRLTELAPYFATETFQPGREIVRQNDPGDKFYIIARGKVEVWRTEEHTGRIMRVALLQDGDFFGEITLITGFPRTATVRTLSVCTLISLERGQFNRMLENSPELFREMSDVALKRLRESALVAAASVQ